MPVLSSNVPASPWAPIPLVVALLAGSLLGAVALPASAAPHVDHLVISEIVTGGANATDELIELYNPSAVALPLEGLELAYASAAGSTLNRRAAWETDAPLMPSGTHLLIAHELGVYSSIADVVYSAGLAATGGSVVLRIQGATEAIDAVGWGTAANAWVEGSPGLAPAAGASIERLPGGAAGSTQDTDDNAADFAERLLPDPQNAASSPTPADTLPPTPAASASPSPVPSPGQPAPVSVAVARGLPDDTMVTIQGSALTASDFHDGGGYVADASGGIAVLLDSGTFARGSVLRVTGTVDDRFAQRTIRSGADGLVVVGNGTETPALSRATGTLDETVEAALVRLAGLVQGAPTSLSGGLAFDVDDGSGPARVVVATATGIGTAGWVTGARVELVGVVGQRDSSGSGTSGYRVQPRDEADVIAVQPPTPPSPSPSAGATSNPAPTAGADEPVMSIADARVTPKNTRVTVRGTVTMPTGVIDPVSAVIQDATGAIVLRLGGEVGSLQRGEVVEVNGTRSTLAGMETLRVTSAPRRAGSASEPAPHQLHTGDAAEEHEAMLVAVRGALSAPRRAAGGTISFELDDGSGPLRVVIDASLALDADAFVAGAWVEVHGVLGQETTGAQPASGYRVWPRGAGDLRVIAMPAPGDGDGVATPAPGRGLPRRPAAGGAASLAGITSPGLADLRVVVTLVATEWPELGIGGLLWDGERLVAIAGSSSDAVSDAIGSRQPPLVLELRGLRVAGEEPTSQLPTVWAAADGVKRGSGPVSDPVGSLPPSDAPAQWVSLVGQVVRADGGVGLRVGSKVVALDLRCAATPTRRAGAVAVTGIGFGSPARIIVPCGGLRAAPALALAHGRTTVAPPRGEGALPPGSVAHAGSDAPVRWMAAALLGMSVIGLLGAAAARRWLDDNEPQDAPETAARPVDGPEPKLRLVRVPRERGSP